MRPLRIFVVLAAPLVLLAQATTSLAAAPVVPVVPVVSALAALHRGEIAGTGLTWRSSFLLDLGTAALDEPLEVRLAVPLPIGEALTGPMGVSALVESDRIVGFRIDPGAIAGRTLQLSLVQPYDARLSRLHLGAPLAAGDELQIVEVRGEDGARFEPDAALGLVHEIGYFAARTLEASARHTCEQLLEYRPRSRDTAPLYVRAAGPIARRGGIDGSLSTHRGWHSGGVIGAAVAFAAIVVALFVAQRRLSQATREEEAEALLAAEFEQLEVGSRKSRCKDG